MRRLTIPDTVVAWDRVGVPTGRPGNVDTACLGLAIAPESHVRGVMLRFPDGSKVPLIEGAPVVVPGLQPVNNIEVTPLDYQSGNLVLALAECRDELPLLPRNIATRAVLAVKVADASVGRTVRIHRPRGAVSAVCEFVVAIQRTGWVEFDTDPDVSVKEWHLDHLGRAESRDGIDTSLITAQTLTAGNYDAAFITAKSFRADVLEVSITGAVATQEIHMVVSTSGATL